MTAILILNVSIHLRHEYWDQSVSSVKVMTLCNSLYKLHILFNQCLLEFLRNGFMLLKYWLDFVKIMFELNFIFAHIQIIKVSQF